MESNVANAGKRQFGPQGQTTCLSAYQCSGFCGTVRPASPAIGQLTSPPPRQQGRASSAQLPIMIGDGNGGAGGRLAVSLVRGGGANKEGSRAPHLDWLACRAPSALGWFKVNSDGQAG